MGFDVKLWSRSSSDLVRIRTELGETKSQIPYRIRCQNVVSQLIRFRLDSKWIGKIKNLRYYIGFDVKMWMPNSSDVAGFDLDWKGAKSQILYGIWCQNVVARFIRCGRIRSELKIEKKPRNYMGFDVKMWSPAQSFNPASSSEPNHPSGSCNSIAKASSAYTKR